MIITNPYANSWKQAIPEPRGVIAKTRKLTRGLVLDALSLLDKPSENSFLRCLYCHNVFDDQKKEFEDIIVRLKSFGSFIDTDTCVKMLNGVVNVDGRFFHLSFDDGFKNNAVNALPILIRHDIPAIFFTPSSLIGASWVTAMDYCLYKTDYAGVIELMDVNDLRRIRKSGYEIGSHTKTHARLSSISSRPFVLEDEVIGSKRELEKLLDFECKYIAWPYGTIQDIDAISIETIEKAGYHACFGAYRGHVYPEKTSVYSIPRHHFEVHWPLRHVEYFARGNFEKR